MPLAKASPARPPRAPRGRTRAPARVGLPVRPYSKPACLPTASWAKVVARLMGVTTAPVTGSEGWPAWIARVSKPGAGPGRPLTRPRPRPSGEEAEHVAAADEPDRMTAVEHEKRGGRVELRDQVADRLPDPDHRHGRAHDRPDRLVEDVGIAERAIHERELVEHPAHLFRRERRLLADRDHDLGDAEVAHQRPCVARRLVGRDEHEVGDRAVLGREHVAGAVTVATDEAEVHHPGVVVDLRQVATAGVRQQDDDQVLRSQLGPHDERRVHSRPARPADEQAFLAGHAARGGEGLRVGDHDRPVDERRVEGGRPEVLADPLDEVRAPGAPGVHRALGIGTDDLHSRDSSASGTGRRR